MSLARQTPRRWLHGCAVLTGCLVLAGSALVARTGASPADRAIATALAQLGDPYRWGGSGPDGFDCSGLTSLAWRDGGGVQDIPRTSQKQQSWAVPLPVEQLLPGDLVFFGTPVSHVGLYLGGGRMVDASSSQGRVTERALWGGVVRYGRVPRPGMSPVRPWDSGPAAGTGPSSGAGTVGQATGPDNRATGPDSRATGPDSRATGPDSRATGPILSRVPVRAPALTKVGQRSVVEPLRGLPWRQRHASTRTASRAADGAASVAGSSGFDDVRLVREAWRHAGAAALPASRSAIEAAGRPVRLADARRGDLVVYGAPAQHLGVYLGHRYMADASKVRGRVVVRQVFTSSSVRLVRLPG